MKFTRRRAVSPIIASLLLIAIAVAAGIIVYVYVNSLAGGLTSGGGSQVSSQLQMQAYSFQGLNGNGTGGSTNGVVAVINMENTGGSSLTISAVYYNGVALNPWAITTGKYSANFLVPTTAGQNCYAILTSSPVVQSVTHTTSAPASGIATACGTEGSSTCAANACFTTGNAASDETPNLTIASQGTAQLVIGIQGGSVSGTSNSVKVVTATGGTAVFSITAGRTG